MKTFMTTFRVAQYGTAEIFLEANNIEEAMSIVDTERLATKFFKMDRVKSYHIDMDNCFEGVYVSDYFTVEEAKENMTEVDE